MFVIVKFIRTTVIDLYHKALTSEVLLQVYDAHVVGHAVEPARAHHVHAGVARRRAVLQLHRLHELRGETSRASRW